MDMFDENPPPVAADTNVMAFMDNPEPSPSFASPDDNVGQASDFSNEDPFAAMPAAPVGGGGMAVPSAGNLDAVRNWEAKNEERIQEVAQRELHEKKAKREAAVTDLNEFYSQRKEELKKRMEYNRKLEAEWVASQSTVGTGQNSWERVMSMIDDAPAPAADKPMADLSRMKSLLINLKNDPIAMEQ